MPQDTLAIQHQGLRDSNFPGSIRVNQIILSAQGDEDIATRKGVLELLTLLEAVESTVSSSSQTYSEVCERAIYGTLEFCQTSSMLDIFFDLDYLVFDGEGKASFTGTLRAKVETLSDDEVRNALFDGPYVAWNNIAVLPKQLMHSYGLLNSASAFKMLIILSNSDEEAAYDWEDYMERELFGADVSYDVYVATIRNNQDAGAAQTSDVPLLTIGIILAVIYICHTLGHLNSVQSRFGLGICAVFAVVLAAIAMVGICSLFSFYGPVHTMLPLLLVAIGIDDAFVIMTAFDDVKTDCKNGVSERIARGLSRAGSAITITSFTNAFAFFMGATTRIPAMRYFAIWAGVGILFDFILQATFFVGCMTLDASRQAAGKFDVLCCFESKKKPTKNIFGQESGVLRRFYEHLAPNLQRKLIYIPILFISFGLFGVSIYGAIQLDYKFDLEDLYADGSSVQKFASTNNRYFATETSLFPTEVYTGDIDYTDINIQQQMTGLFDTKSGLLISNTYYAENTVNSWYTEFRQHANMTNISRSINPDSYYTHLSQFLLSDEGSSYNDDLIFDINDKGEKVLIFTRTRFALKIGKTTNNRIDAMNSIRSTTDASGLSNTFAFSGQFTVFERDASVKNEAVLILSAALFTVFAVTLFLIGSFRASLVALLGPALSVIDMLGMMYYFDIDLNTISVICLALSVGITMDFSSHITIGYVNSSGSRHDRVCGSLGDLGPALTHAGISTFLCTGVLVFSRTYVFKIFFKMFMLIIVFGMFHGLVFVPIVLNLIGPTDYFKQEETLEMQEDKLVVKFIENRKETEIN